MKTDAQQLASWLDNIPDIYNGKFKRDWLLAQTTRKLKKAIAAKCQDCCCWEAPEIRDCQVITCPLWPHRGNKSEPDRVDKVLRAAQELFETYEAENPRHTSKEGQSDG